MMSSQEGLARPKGEFDDDVWLRWVIPTVLLCCSALLLFYRLGQLSLWESDEARFALKALMMQETGNWLIPIRKGQVWLNKPPLHMWFINLVALGGGGINEVTARVPSALAAMGTVLPTFWWGWRSGGSLFGGMAGLILLTSGHFLLMGRYNLPEQVLTFFVTLALVSFYAGYHGWLGKGAWYTMYAAFGFATLTKGPVGVFLPLLVILTYLVIRHDLPAIRQMQWAPGLLLYAGITLPWYVAVSVGYGQSVQPALFGEIVKAVLASRGHAEPWYFYLWTFPLSFAPWTLFLPGLFVVCQWRRRYGGGIPDSLSFAGIWWGVMFLVFSVASQKRSYYLLPLFPAAAFLVASVWAHLVTFGETCERWLRRYLVIVLVATLAFAVFLTGSVGLEEFGLAKGIIPVTESKTALFFLILLLLPLFQAVWSGVRRQFLWAFCAFGVTLAGLVLFGIRFHAPTRDIWTAKSTGIAMKQLVGGRAEVWAYGLYSDGISFYFGRDIPPLEDAGQVDDRLRQGLPVYILADQRVAQNLQGRYPAINRVCREFYYRKRNMQLILLTNQDCPKKAHTKDA
jgi:4-amino-4-deoxy-L-arabinose transferase-like glycosyltransferase